MTHFNIEQYLRRIGLEQRPEISLAGLQQLHRQHFFTIPFENFDIPLGCGIDVTPAAIYHKLVNHQRGGYCFETNGLLLQALQAFGFSAKALLARVHLSETPSGRSHQFSLVSIDGQDWLVDAGFGSQTPRQPLPLTKNMELNTDLQSFQLIEDPQFGFILQQHNGEQWENLYSFDLQPVHQGDIEYANHCTATMPTSTFTNVWCAALPTATGINTLLNHTFKETKDEQVKTQELNQDDTYMDALEEHFGIQLNATYEDLIS